MVYVLAMGPSFAAMLCIEFIPLAAVEDGWVANWALWVRCFITSMLLSLGVCVQLKTMVPLARLSNASIILIAFGAACGYVISLVLLAKYWAFPVPFTVVLGTPGWLTMALSCSGFAIGAKKICESAQLRAQLYLLIVTSIIQYSMLIIYPAYNAGFLALSSWAQLGFILVLPAIKYLMKRILKRVAGDNDDRLMLAKISADLFQALYSFKCMQSAGSIQSGLALIAVDLVVNIYHLHGLHRKVARLPEHLGDRFDSRDLVASFITLAHSHDPTRLPKKSRSMGPGVAAVLPEPITSSNIPTRLLETRDVDQTADALFQKCQEVVLVEFIESIVPVFYVLYIVILAQLPNAKYYPEMQHMTAARLGKLVGSISIYASLEFLSLVYVHVLLKWRFNLSVLHLLAFTLETQPTVLQGTFMAWVMINLQFTLVHYGERLRSVALLCWGRVLMLSLVGIDYTFRFPWLH